ncbi:MAG TPA: dihydrodipicolinate reductase C-terminal domain-containing protein [Candidatus Saccharimonadales bacterium]|nr:dihydrodipicolinate reductase C-terminal domain-containing protein [Candidatus Saccharimonadales bacterium]
MPTTILGDGHLGWAVASAAGDRGERIPVLGRPIGRRHDPAALAGADVLVDASRGDAVLANVSAGIDAGVGRFVLAATGWAEDRDAVEATLRAAGAAAVTAASFSLGVALFSRLVERAAELFGAVEGFDPYLVEWHRRGKLDRPSGTALELGRRLSARLPEDPTSDELEVVSIRAGSSPGMHLVGFDAAGETIELRLTARDRTAYATGILAAVDWLGRAPRTPGLHPFDAVVDELLASPALAA